MEIPQLMRRPRVPRPYVIVAGLLVGGGGVHGLSSLQSRVESGEKALEELKGGYASPAARVQKLEEQLREERVERRKLEDRLDTVGLQMVAHLEDVERVRKENAKRREDWVQSRRDVLAEWRQNEARGARRMSARLSRIDSRVTTSLQTVHRVLASVAATTCALCVSSESSRTPACQRVCTSAPP